MRSRIMVGWILVLVLTALTVGLMITESGTAVDCAEWEVNVDWIVAYEKVHSEILNDSLEGTWLYAYPKPTSSRSTIDTWYGSIELPDEGGWVFFIDDIPMENWAHPCRYVFIDNIGRISVYNAYGPPNNFEEWKKLSLCYDTMIAECEQDYLDFKCIVAGDRIFYWHQKGTNDQDVAEDFVLCVFNRSSCALIVNDLHCRRNLAEKTSPVILSRDILYQVRETFGVDKSPTAMDGKIPVVQTRNETTTPCSPAQGESHPANTMKMPGFGGILSAAGFFGAFVFSGRGRKPACERT